MADERSLTPRWANFKGLYNAPKHGNENTSSIQDANELHVRAGLQKPSFEEVTRISDFCVALRQLIREQRGSLEYGVGFDDRTAWLSISPGSLIDMKLLDLIRGHLIAKEPDWRFALGDGGDSSTIVVYPSRIMFPQDGNSETSLREVQEKLEVGQAVEQEEENQIMRQRALMQKLVASQAPLQKPPYEPRVIAVAEFGPSSRQQILVWLLQDGFRKKARSWIPDELLEDGFQGIRSEGNVAFNEKGEPVDYSWVNPEIVGVLSALSYDKSVFRNEFFLVDPTTKKRRTVKVLPEAILNDAQVTLQLSRIR